MYAIVGLGYVGLGLAVALSKHSQVIGYDINSQRIEELKNHQDSHLQVSTEELKSSPVSYTHHLNDLKSATFFIVVVSTPAYFYETPDLDMLISASESIGSILKKDDIIVFESTVYPGTTEEICIPILQEKSGLIAGVDFNVGYSPERINPGDSTNTLKTVTKIISAQNEHTLKAIQKTYQMICDRVYPVSSISTAEAVKILENTQRDINIAFMNEFTQIMHALNLNTQEIIEGAKTKWSFVPFKPGLVGGHCISIDPQYLVFNAKRHGVNPELILAARHINDSMPQFIIDSLLKLLAHHAFSFKDLKIGILGITYKENVKDVRNSLILKLLRDLKNYGFNCQVHDPFNPPLIDKLGKLSSFDDLKNLSVVILAVGHNEYLSMGIEEILNKCHRPCIFMDIPSLFIQTGPSIPEVFYWHL